MVVRKTGIVGKPVKGRKRFDPAWLQLVANSYLYRFSSSDAQWAQNRSTGIWNGL